MSKKEKVLFGRREILALALIGFGGGLILGDCFADTFFAGLVTALLGLSLFVASDIIKR